MDWRSIKFLLASTATAAFASQVAVKLYKKFTASKSQKVETPADDTCTKVINIKDREINDVIIFSDQTTYHYIKVPPNKDIKLCESRELNCFKLIRYIKSARETLDVCMYLITSTDIAEQIIRLGQKHVLVRILVDRDMAHTNGSQIKRLQQYSFIQIQTSRRPALMHHKFCIVDGPVAIKHKNKLKAQAEKLNVFGTQPFSFYKRDRSNKKIKGFVMSGSLNWSTQAMVGNYDNVVVTSNENVVVKFEKEFVRLWQEEEVETVVLS